MTPPPLGRPASGEYAPFYANYVGLVPDGDVLVSLELQRQQAKRLFAGISEARAAHRYAPGKWSIKGVLGHVTDSERVFAYRALAFARGDAHALPGFDEKEWAAEAQFDDRTLESLLGQYDAVRGATLALFGSLPEEAWSRRGTANDYAVTVRGLAWIIAGHELHHLQVLRERYL